MPKKQQKKAAGPKARPQPKKKSAKSRPAPAKGAAAKKPAATAKKAPASRPKAAPRPLPASARSKRLPKKEVDRFRLILEVKRSDLTRHYQEEVQSSRRQSGDGIEDYVDYAVSSYTKEFLLSLSDLERRQLLLVEGALRRIQGGSFGLCDECGERIGEKRLVAVPWARHCIRCQNLEEQGLLSYRSSGEVPPYGAAVEGEPVADEEVEESEPDTDDSGEGEGGEEE